MANIADKINKIRTAIRGLEVRSSLADGLTAVNGEVEINTTNQTNLKKEFDKLIITAGNSLGDLNISISEGHDLKQQLDKWVNDNGDILNLHEKVNRKTRIEVCTEAPESRESNTFYFKVTDVQSGGGPSDIKVSPTMGIKVI